LSKIWGEDISGDTHLLHLLPPPGLSTTTKYILYIYQKGFAENSIGRPLPSPIQFRNPLIKSKLFMEPPGFANF
jgi:hypothetical protein